MTSVGRLFPLVLGFVDGILTALTLAAGRMTTASEPLDFDLALRIAMGTLVAGAFTFFVARYAQVRQEFVRAERQLSVAAHGQLAASRLGRQALLQTFVSSIVSSVAAFFGALVPLVPAVMLPHYRWVSVATALVALGFLAVGLARVLRASPVWWCLGLVFGGAALTAIGTYLRIVS